MKNSRKKTNGRKKRGSLNLSSISNDFVRGFFSYALVAAVEDSRSGNPNSALKALGSARVLRTSTLYGAALVAGVAAGEAVERRDYVTALAAIAGGAAGVYALDRLLSSVSHKE
ncbi:MAG: hypothetical protein LBS89_06735 [Zoogloeaceae bacterium]|jgi:hypothetical protein|nr:hypothetical protein [Zoogloeaceae bacterium]